MVQAPFLNPLMCIDQCFYVLIECNNVWLTIENVFETHTQVSSSLEEVL